MDMLKWPFIVANILILRNQATLTEMDEEQRLVDRKCMEGTPFVWIYFWLLSTGTSKQ